MRDNRDRWQFFDKHPTKRAITPREVRYWKILLDRVLKVGIEFEFNLRDQTGDCKGDNSQCPCNHIETECWKLCANTKECTATKQLGTCANRNSDCTTNTCKECNNYKFICIGITCVDFVSQCFVCDKFIRNCETCPRKYDANRDPSAIREILSLDLKPSKHYGKVSDSGVVTITTDGSLLGDKGVEIITVGRRIDFWEFYKMSDRIIKKVLLHGGYLNERTSSHMHVLSSHYNDGMDRGVNELEKSMPSIILANLHQLVRRYQNALTWMTIALADPNHMTRWEKFRVSVLDISAVIRDMRTVANEVHKTAGNKYGFINYDNVQFNKNDISRFHVEFRQADSTLSPSYYAAISCMHYALAIKAVEISRWGLLKVGDEEWLKRARSMKNIILNGCGDWSGSRTSDTSKLIDNREYFIEESIDLVTQLKAILLKVGPAYDVLMKLAEKPVAVRLIEGDSWEKIEKDLSVKINKEDEVGIRLEEIIDLHLIDDCKSTEEWITEVINMVKNDIENPMEITKDQVEIYIDRKTREGELLWSGSTGCMLPV